ncbi:hypothetical protein KAT84_04015 [Candidatus Bipolaricaulota bacterium]|nr:hypothetical protein [Candidatus Bipolaricaulota bacterium]
MRHVILVLCCLLLTSSLTFAQPAEWTIWELPSSKSFPGDLVWMIDNSLFVVLHDPQALARFEPEANRLIAWTLTADPGEFVWTNSGLLFTTPHDAGVGWLQPDFNHVEYWQLPSPMAQPIFAMEAGFGNGVENIWYLEWELGRLGLFEPAQLTIPDEVGPEPQVIPVSRTSGTVSASSQTVAPEFHMADPGFVPAVYPHEPVVSAPFREWGLVTMDPPPYAFVGDSQGNVWVPNVVGDSLLSLAPSTDTVTVYDLPAKLFITSLAAVPDAMDIYFLAIENDGVGKIGVLQPENGSVAMWEIPGGAEIDVVSLIITEDALWFCDRANSAVYRFVPMDGAFTWWETGGDDAPLYIMPGYPGEFWVSWERSGKIARLQLGEP